MKGEISMGWFDRQIRQRMQRDQNVFEESFVRLAGAVLGGRSEKQLEDHFLIAREALEEILKFYRCKAAEAPDAIRDADEQMEYILRPLGIMTRTVAPKPNILIFDEATSALDNKTQKQVSDALDRLKCTRMVVAHRLSTIRNCDRILVLDKGEIIEDGTYDQLIEKGGFFAELVERQRLDQ